MLPAFYAGLGQRARGLGSLCGGGGPTRLSQCALPGRAFVVLAGKACLAGRPMVSVLFEGLAGARLPTGDGAPSMAG